MFRDAGSPIRTCATQESTACSDEVCSQIRFNSTGNGCSPRRRSAPVCLSRISDELSDRGLLQSEQQFAMYAPRFSRARFLASKVPEASRQKRPDMWQSQQASKLMTGAL